MLFFQCGIAIFLCILIINETSAFPCPNYCSRRGRCGPDGKCKCDDKWHGADCSRAKCPKGLAWADTVIGIDIGHQLAECSNRGKCNALTGVCACDIGYVGQACERNACNCNGHGQCVSMQNFALMKDPATGPVFKYNANWDSNKIYGCKCDQGYKGANCLERECPTGDDPLTGFLTDPKGVQVNEKQRVTCKATSGSFYLQFRGQTTEMISHSDTVATVTSKLKKLPTITDVSVKFAGITTTACTAFGNDITIEFTQDFGNVPKLISDKSKLLHSYVNVNPVLTVVEIFNGTKENIPCSGRGRCDSIFGFCTCYTNYFSSNGKGAIGQRGDCGYALTTITQCPGTIACSGHGTCLGPPSYNCMCSNGYTSGDCSQLLCPKGKSWFDLPINENEAHQLVECSNAGQCDRVKGVCACKTGYTGSACNRLACPNLCSGHGTCKTMKDLALTATVNGDAALFTYGNVPNKKETWDFDMIQGCDCNTGYEGHDCSRRTCSRGDDVVAVKSSSGDATKKHEVQVLTCTGTTGSFSLSFRQQTTSLIPFSASASSVKSSLEALTTIGIVNVTFVGSGITTSSPACTSNGATKIFVMFWNDLGDLPALKAIVDGITSFKVEVDGVGGSVKGTKENVICSDRGLCDWNTGICKCFQGFTSSNGNGLQGDRGDCGFKEPIYLNSAGKLANN